jgi:hypothetical protein
VQSGVAVAALCKTHSIPRIHISLIVRAVTFKVSPSILYSLGTYCCYFASSLCFSRHVTAVTWPIHRHHCSHHLPSSLARSAKLLFFCASAADVARGPRVRPGRSMVTFATRSIETLFSGCSRTRREKSRRQPMTNFNAV